MLSLYVMALRAASNHPACQEGCQEPVMACAIDLQTPVAGEQSRAELLIRELLANGALRSLNDSCGGFWGNGSTLRSPWRQTGDRN